MVFFGGSGLNAARGGGASGAEYAASTQAISGLTPRSRTGRPVKRPPHIVGMQNVQGAAAGGTGSWFVNTAKSDKGQVLPFSGIVGAPPLLPPEQEGAADEGMTPRCDPLGQRYAAAEEDPPEELTAGCAGGRMHRPDTCYLTHVYVKQEVTYLSRRVDELCRYFIALEQMLGTGTLGPLLQKSSQEVEAKLEVASTLEDVDEIRGLIDAAVRLGFGAQRYAPLRERLHWLEVGQQREDVRRRLAELADDGEDTSRQRRGRAGTTAAAARAGGPVALTDELQALIDEATHLGVEPSELTVARRCLQEAEQLVVDEQMLAAAAKGDIGALEGALRHGANVDAQRMEDGASLWHLATDLPSTQGLALARLASRVCADAQQLNSAGHTPLMAAAAQHKDYLVKELLDYGVDPDARSVAVEHMVECPDKIVLADALALVDDKTKRVIRRLDVCGLYFDTGDELLCGEDLQLPVFRRAALRSALHFAVMRAGSEGAEVLILEALIAKSADINVSDELGCTPLWYAAHAGNVASVNRLLLQGACLLNTNGISVLMAAHNCHVHAASSDDAALVAGSAAIARHLIREGACDGASFSPGFNADCQISASVEEAIALSGGTVDMLAALQEQSRACQERFGNRLLLQTARRLTSAAEAAHFAAAAFPAFQQLLFSAARQTGGHARICRRPTANRLLRLARQAAAHPVTQMAQEGLLDESQVDWGRIIAAVHGRLDYHDIDSLRQALQFIELSYGFHIRGFHNRLIGESDSSTWIAGECLNSGCMTFMVEVNGAICALHLTVGRVAELADMHIAEGTWLRSELSEAISRGSMAEVTQTLEQAEEYLGEPRLATVLRMPLNTDHGSPTGLGGDFYKDTPICAAVRARHINIVDLLLKSRASPNSIAADGVSAVTLAAQCKDIPCLQLLLTSGADPATLDMDNVEASDSKEAAARLVMQVVTQRLLDTKALADLVEHFDHSPEALHEALTLLQAGADANTQTLGGGPDGEPMSVLSCAIKHGSRRLVHLLLRFKAQVRSTAGSPSALKLAKGTPLEAMVTFQACEELQVAVNTADMTAIQELLEAGIDPETLFSDTVTHEAKTLLQYAAELPAEIAATHVEDLLRRGADPERRDGRGRTLLLTCIEAGRPQKIVEVLLGYGADVTAADNDGVTAAMHAATLGLCATLEALLEAGQSNNIDVGSMQDLGGLDALAYALKSGQAAAAHILLQRGYKTSQHGAIEQIFRACRNVNVTAVQNLLEILETTIYPNIVITTEDGQEGAALTSTPTLLMEAARVQSVEIIEILVQHGAFLYPRCATCSSSDSCNGEIAPLEEEEPSTYETAWSIAGDHEGLRSVLRSGFARELLVLVQRHDEVGLSNLRAEEKNGLIPGPDDFEIVDDMGCGALDHAIKNDNETLETWLIEHGACLQSSEMRGTALLEPVKRGHADVVSRRLGAGADVHAVDSQGWTLMDWSVLAGHMSGYVWFCVDMAIQRSEYEMSDDHDPDESRSVRDGGSIASVAASLSSSFRRQTARGWSKPTFNMEVEEIAPEPDRPHRQRFDSNKQSIKSNTLSVSNMSFHSFGTSVAASSRSSAGHSRKKKTDPTPDPRQTHAAVEQLIVDAGGKLGVQVRGARYCLWAPMNLRQLDTVRRRIRAGADCTVLNEKGNSLAHYALDTSNPVIATHLIEAGADPDKRDHRGRTVIWRAVENKNVDLVGACIEHGSDLQQGFGADNQGSLAHMALETGQVQMAIQLLVHEPKGSSPDALSHGKSVTWRALELRKPEVARTCLELKADLTGVDMLTGRGLLHLALEVDVTFAAELIKAGVSANLEDKRGRSPLTIAAGQGVQDIVDASLEVGARPGQLGGLEAWSALKNGHAKLAEQLIRAAGPCRPRSSKKSHKPKGKDTLQPGPRSSSTRRNSNSGNVVQQQEFQLLLHAVQASHQDVVVAYLEMSLTGVPIEEDDARELAGELATWVLESSKGEETENRVELLEALPATVLEEGTSVAAGDLQKSGAPAELVQRMARAEVEVSMSGGYAGNARLSSLSMMRTLDVNAPARHSSCGFGGPRTASSVGIQGHRAASSVGLGPYRKTSAVNLASASTRLSVRDNSSSEQRSPSPRSRILDSRSTSPKPRTSARSTGHSPTEPTSPTGHSQRNTSKSGSSESEQVRDSGPDRVDANAEAKQDNKDKPSG